MSNVTPDPAPEVKADPKRPYKAIAGAFVTFLGLLWAALEGRDNLGNMTAMEWASIVIPVILTFATVYGITNPKVPVGGANRGRGEVGAGEARLFLIIVGAIILALVLWQVIVRA